MRRTSVASRTNLQLGHGLVKRRLVEGPIVALLVGCQHGVSSFATPAQGPDEPRLVVALWQHAGEHPGCSCRFALEPGGWVAA